MFEIMFTLLVRIFVINLFGRSIVLFKFSNLKLKGWTQFANTLKLDSEL